MATELSERRYTNGDAIDIIDNEGIGYAIRHYIDGDEFQDPITRNLWCIAAKILDTLVEHLARQTGREVHHG